MTSHLSPILLLLLLNLQLSLIDETLKLLQLEVSKPKKDTHVPSIDLHYFSRIYRSNLQIKIVQILSIYGLQDRTSLCSYLLMASELRRLTDLLTIATALSNKQFSSRHAQQKEDQISFSHANQAILKDILQ
jgi:hypothetical protein